MPAIKAYYLPQSMLSLRDNQSNTPEHQKSFIIYISVKINFEHFTFINAYLHVLHISTPVSLASVPEKTELLNANRGSSTKEDRAECSSQFLRCMSSSWETEAYRNILNCPNGCDKFKVCYRSPLVEEVMCSE